MTRGYLVLAQNSIDADYVRMAYALALSIKNTQSTVSSISLITDIDVSSIDNKIKNLFDNIIPISNNLSAGTEWKIENKWQYYNMSPYDETVILDADMIFPSDISHWWDILSAQDIWITDRPKTFRGETITSSRYRKTFISNELPNVYTAFMYFKKCQLAEEFFDLVSIIFHNWEKFFYEFLDETRPHNLSGDVAYALAIKILGIEHLCFGSIDSVPSFVHMKGLIQGIDEKYITEDWTKHIPTYFSPDGNFKIGNYRQTLPFHYHVKHWLSNDILQKLEAIND